MMIDPVQALEGVLKTTTSTGTTSTKHTVSPIPTIIPSLPIKETASDVGERTLWVVFAVMFISTIVFTGMSWRVPISKRLYHVVTTLITTFAALSYYAMATGTGKSLHHTRITEEHDTVPDTHRDIYREVYWARYVDWSVTTPLLLLDLMLLAGASGGSMFIAIVADLIMILTGLFAAFAKDEGTKWGWYTMACAAYLVIIYQLVVGGRVTAHARGSKVGKFFVAIGGYTLLLWTIYPIIWGVADGSRKLDVDQEIISYAVLDILAKPVFGAWLLFTHASIPETNVELGGFWAHGLASEGAIRVGDDDEGA